METLPIVASMAFFMVLGLLPFASALTPVQSPVCGVAASGLTGKEDNIYFVLENTGSAQEDIDYSIKINLNKTATGRQTVQAGQKKEVLIPFVFKIGSYQLEVSATVACGASDYISSGYSKIGPTKCTNPQGSHGNFRSNSTEGKVYKCNNGVWELANDFLYCNINRCGDGVLNCGETRDTCPQDFMESSAKCDCARRAFVGQPGYPSPFQFYDACKTNCTLKCVSDFDCGAGYYCSDFGCISKENRCGVKIQDSDYTKQFSIGDNGQAFATIKNTGLIRENITFRLFVDNAKINETFFTADSETDKLSSLEYKAGIGDHTLKLEAVADCGSKDAAATTFSVKNIIIIQPTSQPPLATQAIILTQSIETQQDSEKSASVAIKTTRPQIFTLSVSGVPSDWLDYPTVIGVTDEKTINIFVKPKQAGNFRLTITVQGSEEAFNLFSNLKVMPQVTANNQADQNTLIVLGLLTLVFLGIVLYAGTKHLKL